MSGSGGFNSGGFARPQQRQPMRQKARPQARPQVSQPPQQQAAPIPQQPSMQSPGIPTGTGGMNAQDFYNKYNYKQQPQYQPQPYPSKPQWGGMTENIFPEQFPMNPQMGGMPQFSPYGWTPQGAPFGKGGMMQGIPYGKGGMGGGMFGGGGMQQRTSQGDWNSPEFKQWAAANPNLAIMV